MDKILFKKVESLGYTLMRETETKYVQGVNKVGQAESEHLPIQSG